LHRRERSFVRDLLEARLRLSRPAEKQGRDNGGNPKTM
jgi:hypothetical protein